MGSSAAAVQVQAGEWFDSFNNLVEQARTLAFAVLGLVVVIGVLTALHVSKGAIVKVVMAGLTGAVAIWLATNAEENADRTDTEFNDVSDPGGTDTNGAGVAPPAPAGAGGPVPASSTGGAGGAGGGGAVLRVVPALSAAVVPAAASGGPGPGPGTGTGTGVEGLRVVPAGPGRLAVPPGVVPLGADAGGPPVLPGAGGAARAGS